MSFTPGPWHSDLQISSQSGRVAIEPDIAIVYVQPSRYDESLSKQRLANARLIAAAPDLLAALIDLREHHKNEYQSDRAIDAQADAAIAKAKGAGS